MQVKKEVLREVLGNNATRYEIPLYQRTFDWRKPQFEKLWEDVSNLARAKAADPSSEHFLGTLVLGSGHSLPSDFTFLVVDGQQRLTTLTMLLAAVRDIYYEYRPDTTDADELSESVLVHRYKNTHPERFRLWPTQGDREEFTNIIERQTDLSGSSNLVTAYKYFKAELLKTTSDTSDITIDQVRSAILDSLRFVTIVAEPEDNVYSIFESLNNTGLKLTQGDLLRNFFFSRLGDLAETVYNRYWYPMQERLSRDDLAHLFWLELTWSNTEVKKDDTFKQQVHRLQNLNPQDLEKEVKRFSDLSKRLEVMRHPRKESDPSVAIALQRLVDFGIESIDPLVLGLLSKRQSGKITSQQTAAALSTIESFLVRRLLVRAPHNALSRILMRAYGFLDFNDVNNSLLEYFTKDNKDFASNDQIADAVISVNFYRSGTTRQRKTFLSWLEQKIAGNEPASLTKTTIEHVMPQNLTSDWIADLSTDLGEFGSPEAVHETFVHTLANLTLTGYNSNLSDRSFAKKKILLEERGNIEMNKYISEKNYWRRSEILNRGKYLSDLIAQIWVSPLDQDNVDYSSLDSSQINELLSQVPSGFWVTIGDLAEELHSTVVVVKRLLQNEKIPNVWKLLEANGHHEGNRNLGGMSPEDRLNRLKEDGVRFSESGEALHTQRWSFTSESTSSANQSNAASGPIREFLDEASNRLAPALSEALTKVLNARTRMGDQVLFGIDADDTDILTAQLPTHDQTGHVELRLTLANGLWANDPARGEFEISDPNILQTDFSRD